MPHVYHVNVELPDGRIFRGECGATRAVVALDWAARTVDGIGVTDTYRGQGKRILEVASQKDDVKVTVRRGKHLKRARDFNDTFEETTETAEA